MKHRSLTRHGRSGALTLRTRGAFTALVGLLTETAALVTAAGVPLWRTA